MHSIKPAIDELEKTFSKLVSHYGLNYDNNPVITIQSKGRKDAYGWHWANKWQNGKSLITEINLSAEYLTENNPVKTLIHELAHFDNNQKGIKDCSANQYHNKRFKEKAELFGLDVSQVPKTGYSSTTISADLQKTLDKLDINLKVFDLFRLAQDKKPKAPTKMKKWSCGCTNVRCAVDLVARCEGCGGQFELGS